MVLICTTPFRELAGALLPTLGTPQLRVLTVEHPLGELDEAAVRARVAAALEQLWSQLEAGDGGIPAATGSGSHVRG